MDIEGLQNYWTVGKSGSLEDKNGRVADWTMWEAQARTVYTKV